jgi:hypothetical protein
MIKPNPYTAILNNRPIVYAPKTKISSKWYYIIIALWLIMVLANMSCYFLLKLFIQQAIAIGLLILSCIFIGATEILVHRIILCNVVYIYAMVWMFNPPVCNKW